MSKNSVTIHCLRVVATFVYIKGKEQTKYIKKEIITVVKFIKNLLTLKEPPAIVKFSFILHE